MRPTTTTLLALAALLGAPVDAHAQYRKDDDRDRILLKDGKEVFARVLWQHDPEGELHVLLPKGRVKRFDEEDVLQIETVTQDVEAFLAVRSPSASLDEEWALVEWARDQGLDGLARAQAYHMLTRSPNDERAHEFLGHKPRGSNWRWAADGGSKLMNADDWAEYHQDTGHPLVLEGEHYILRTTADLTNAVDILFDLERTYVEFHREFGSVTTLQAHEVVRRPMTVWVYRDVDRFPATGSAKLPYYAPGLLLEAGGAPESGSGNELRTYYGERGNFPLQLFELAAQQLLYTCVLGETQSQWSEEFGFYRESAWLEVGFGNWFGSQFAGRPGYVERRDFQLDPADAAESRSRTDVLSLKRSGKEITNLIGLNYEFFLQNNEGDRRAVEARANTLFAFLMDDDTRFVKGKRAGQKTRPALLAYMREVYLTSKGGSSSAFDDALGAKVETLQQPWKSWLLKF